MAKDDEWAYGAGKMPMPRPKGPEKVAFKVMVTIPTFNRLVAKAKGKAVGAYIAEREEQATVVAAKNAQRDVEPRFKGKK